MSHAGGGCFDGRAMKKAKAPKPSLYERAMRVQREEAARASCIKLAARKFDPRLSPSRVREEQPRRSRPHSRGDGVDEVRHSHRPSVT